jgi:hypothetical protein
VHPALAYIARRRWRVIDRCFELPEKSVAASSRHSWRQVGSHDGTTARYTLTSSIDQFSELAYHQHMGVKLSFAGALAVVISVACGSSNGNGNGSGGSDCESACAHAASACPSQFQDQAKCNSGCATLTPGQIACLRTDTACNLLESCVGDSAYVARTGAPSAQCQTACAHAGQVCPQQFQDQAKCVNGCQTVVSPGQAACLGVETTCDRLVACVGE